ncbi:MAG TPA: hypothetical protein VFY31_03405 [Macromonas sp.]|nr:hypothetical protein [Macromonas sp.]
MRACCGVWVWSLAALLAGCGLDTLGSAATGAAVKQQEVQQGQAQLEQVQQQLQQSNALEQQRQKALEDASR